MLLLNMPLWRAALSQCLEGDDGGGKSCRLLLMMLRKVVVGQHRKWPLLVDDAHDGFGMNHGGAPSIWRHGIRTQDPQRLMLLQHRLGRRRSARHALLHHRGLATVLGRAEKAWAHFLVNGRPQVIPPQVRIVRHRSTASGQHRDATICGRFSLQHPPPRRFLPLFREAPPFQREESQKGVEATEPEV